MAAKTKKQRECPHPAAHTHPTFDPRWQVCDLCHTVSPRPILAPWVALHDAEQPAPQAPTLFAR
jgi:hypothetical protein